jgi:hypothetical protein
MIFPGTGKNVTRTSYPGRNPIKGQVFLGLTVISYIITRSTGPGEASPSPAAEIEQGDAGRPSFFRMIRGNVS